MTLSLKGRLATAPNVFRNASRRLFRSRAFSTKPDDVRPEASQKARARIERISSRLPKFLRGYTAPLVNAPLSHILAFLLLHELTAVVPLFALAGTFHYTNWLPSLLTEGKWVAEGIDRFGRYFRRKGWLEEGIQGSPMTFGRGESGNRIVVEFATAYAVTKVLLPLRLLLSVWATPWFARVAILPGTSLFRRMFLMIKRP